MPRNMFSDIRALLHGVKESLAIDFIVSTGQVKEEKRGISVFIILEPYSAPTSGRYSSE
jgi:hypothetical protein